MRDDPQVVGLVVKARKGEQDAWDEIVERYSPLLWSICLRYRLDRSDALDVAQTVWLRLVEHLAGLREPAALPGWIAMTAQRECLRVYRSARRRQDVEQVLDVELKDESAVVHEEVERAERRLALRRALAELPEHCRTLLGLFLRETPLSYAQISEKLGMPIGGIGPQRARCLARLRRHPSLSGFADPEQA
ncbi:RNA polymerase sigma factor [Nonomuraea basaltis]|uniref:RNA polymerase sigma factor n=1 Tax=Nonomuraea basaltis TaxID=2495887 RepID=UPI00110C67F0|nr:sigma-70 family RNA polymerase sigma factor [Nonomuraea basaltis]TMR94512.1 sigma-70 family RNA polymerase sigma factor [Nonomuraea basaltis]